MLLNESDFFRVNDCRLDFRFSEPNLSLSNTLLVRLGDSVVGGIRSSDCLIDVDDGDWLTAVSGGLGEGLIIVDTFVFDGTLFSIVITSRTSFSNRSLISACCVFALISKSF